MVIESIPASSALKELPLPLQGPAAASSRFPDGVPNIHPKLMLWNSTGPSDTARRCPCSSTAATISHKLEYPSSEKKCTSSSSAITHFGCVVMNQSHDTSGPYIFGAVLSCSTIAVISLYSIPFASDFICIGVPSLMSNSSKSTACDVFLLNPHFGYNFGILAFSIDFSYFSERNDCGNIYSTAGFHTDLYSILFLDCVPPHCSTAIPILSAFLIVLSNSVLHESFGAFACPRLILVWSQIFFDLIEIGSPCSFFSVIESPGLCLILGIPLSLKSRCVTWYLHFDSSNFPPEHHSKSCHSCASSFIFFNNSCSVSSGLPPVMHVESSTNPAILNLTTMSPSGDLNNIPDALSYGIEIIRSI
jgi:hypothetical protein